MGTRVYGIGCSKRNTSLAVLAGLTTLASCLPNFFGVFPILASSAGSVGAKSSPSALLCHGFANNTLRAFVSLLRGARSQVSPSWTGYAVCRGVQVVGLVTVLSSCALDASFFGLLMLILARCAGSTSSGGLHIRCRATLVDERSCRTLRTYIGLLRRARSQVCPSWTGYAVCRGVQVQGLVAVLPSYALDARTFGLLMLILARYAGTTSSGGLAATLGDERSCRTLRANGVCALLRGARSQMLPSWTGYAV